MSFQGKVIVITGAGGNFGREGCLFFAEQGCRVAALDVNSSALEETQTYVKEKIPKAEIIHRTCNVTDAKSVQTAIDSIATEFGEIHLLWNNAGYQGQIKVYSKKFIVFFFDLFSFLI